MNILITGGAGFIGANLARHALDRGHEVRILDDLSTGYVDNLAGLRVDFLQASLLDVEALREAVRGIDSIVHLGALGSVPRSIADPLTTHHANATGSLNVLEAARANGVEHVVCASSSSVYGMNPALPKHEREWVRPMSPYGVSKLAAEQYTLAYQQSYGMATLAFRFFNVFGPLQRAGHVYAAAIPIFIDALLRGAPLPINGDGTQSRDFTYVGSVCRVLVDAVERRVSHPEPVNLAFGTNTSVLTLVKQLSEVTGREAQLDFRPPRIGDVPHSQADGSVLRHLFPEVAPVEFEDGLRRTVAWFEGAALP